MRGLRVSARGSIREIDGPPFGAQRLSDSSFNVYRVDANTTPGNAAQISNFSDGATVIENTHNARLSPDGTKILFQVLSASTGNEEIWLVSSTPGSTATQLVASGTDSCYHASWAPDSDTFVYCQAAGSGLPTGGAIYKDTVSSPGSPTTVRSASAGFSPYRPQFNYDGSKIAYWWQQNLGSSDELRCMNADGSGDASVDTGVGNYDNNNPQTFGWARAANKLCYDAGANAYVINSDGTGRTQINANGDAAAVALNITSDCWAMDDSFVVVTANLGNGYIDLVRAELDGSDTNSLNASHGAANQTWMRGAYVFNSRVWFIEEASGTSGGKISSTLQDGTDYRVHLNVNDGSVLEDIGASGGDGFVWN